MNWRELGLRLAPGLTLAFFAGALGGLLVILNSRRRARNTGFGVVRERAVYQARRWVLGTCLLVALAGASAWLWGTARWNPQVLPTPAPTATLTPIPSPTPRPPTATPTSTATPLPTSAPTETATPDRASSDVELPSTLRGPLPTAAVTPGPSARLIEATMAAGELENMPVDPTTVFVPGTRRVYAFLLFDGMADGVPWTHVWYREVGGQMQEAWGRTELWSHDYSRGQIWRYFDCGAGYHELHIYVGEQFQQKLSFTVKGS